MKRISFLLVVAVTAITAVPAAEPSREITFPFELAIINPDAKEKIPPYIVMFEGGVDDRGRDCRGPVGRLEALRGASKMFPESNQDDGLPVVLRGLRFQRRGGPNGTAAYEVELLGEFNMVRVGVSPDQMRQFLAGQRVTFTLSNEKNYGIISYVSSIKMECQLKGDELYIYDCEGTFSFREGLRRYTSKPKILSPPSTREYLYRAEHAPLPNLPAI